MTTPVTPPVGPRSLLRHPDFLKLWTAETISVFGTQITLLALPIVAATILRVSPFEFGLLATIEFLPFILLSLPAGVIPVTLSSVRKIVEMPKPEPAARGGPGGPADPEAVAVGV